MKIITFGCRLNACESDLIKDFSQELGIVEFILINTCAVTAEAERKLRQTIRKLYKKNKEVKIILTGCASELNYDYYIKMAGVFGIVSNKVKLIKSEYLKYSTCKTIIQKKEHQKVRGFLQIQNGCDRKCTYCVVRLTRGENVSFDKDDIVLQAKKMLQKGYKELVLTGVNISSYGGGLKENLSFIIRYILKNIPELKRLRLSSVDPADIDSELIRVIQNEERLLPHIHESIQSGDNLILKRMMRRHTREQLIEINQKILDVRPDVIFGADIIVGFPTETEEMFENTKSILTEAKISLLHSFPFSKRPGTSAAQMPKVDKKTIVNRSKEIRKLSSQILLNKISEYIDKKVVILAEDDYNAKTNSFLQVRSLEKIEMGEEYLFRCSSIDKSHLVGLPIRKI